MNQLIEIKIHVINRIKMFIFFFIILLNSSHLDKYEVVKISKKAVQIVLCIVNSKAEAKETNL